MSSPKNSGIFVDSFQRLLLDGNWEILLRNALEREECSTDILLHVVDGHYM